MKALVGHVNDICTKHRWNEKILIVDSYSIGEEILQAYTHVEFEAINVKIKTVRSLANDIVEVYAEERFQQMEKPVAIHFMYWILHELIDSGKLRYFTGLEITSSFSRSLLDTITQLRMAGYTSENLVETAFVSTNKALDIKHIMHQYEHLLVAYQMWDYASILQKALDLIPPYNNNTIYILQSNLSLTQLEHQFLEILLPNQIEKLPLSKVYGVQTPQFHDLRSVNWSDPTSLSYIYQPKEATEVPEISLFTANTEEMEIKHMFSQIKKSDQAFDKCMMYYTKPEPYVTTVYHLSEKYQIPVTYGEGIPISFSRPGKLIAAISKWMKNKYSVKDFISIIHEGLIEFSNGAPTKVKITKLLRDASIGWDQTRYLSQLDIFIDEQNRKAMESVDEKRINFLQEQVLDAMWLREWFSILFQKLPSIEGKVDYRGLLNACKYMLTDYGRITSALDEVAKSDMLTTLETVLPYADEQLPFFDAFEKLHDLLLTSNINQSNPKPGHLHICSYKRGVYSTRSTVFVVGLDNRAFPGTPSEDPLLLDQERQSLSGFLPILKEKGQQNVYKMLQVLAHTSGPISLSYCHFSINDNRPVSPSHLFLQVYRLATNNERADFKHIKQLPRTLPHVDVLEGKDYWNRLLREEVDKQLDDSMFTTYENLVFGFQAAMSRKQDRFTAYDGLVDVDANELDPRLNKDRTMTAGKLEKLATCPYAYFLGEVLQLRPIEEVTYDPYSWLDAATRGSLLHSIFETFYKQLKKQKQKPMVSEHEELIFKDCKRKNISTRNNPTTS
ncbi:PD-(D/E)XK nuclease family protein [Aquibacillus koreensis]|uniref:PD-(D/E)XK nuclease family protein n=1 Tax=Aquibacillus koreensis TaxID=279446 RepID=A0A9X3WMM6_9BACI|nr:PD-(D/E)XK nuclease family protein [Aquibacillus koreensis]MCT2537672.1 PD-(D/E)XK nuclease family protein [Aquibacillus koreensis]MDC3420981.1 PD-(D/E)XK nuclease family protein [Aquibacillus koreensis]